MKKLKLKIQDLENPSILTHREIKNILGGNAGGSGGGNLECIFTYTYGTYVTEGNSEDDAIQFAFDCQRDPNCWAVSCMPM